MLPTCHLSLSKYWLTCNDIHLLWSTVNLMSPWLSLLTFVLLLWLAPLIENGRCLYPCHLISSPLRSLAALTHQLALSVCIVVILFAHFPSTVPWSMVFVIVLCYLIWLKYVNCIVLIFYGTSYLCFFRSYHSNNLYSSTLYT